MRIHPNQIRDLKQLRVLEQAEVLISDVDKVQRAVTDLDNGPQDRSPEEGRVRLSDSFRPSDLPIISRALLESGTDSVTLMGETNEGVEFGKHDSQDATTYERKGGEDSPRITVTVDKRSGEYDIKEYLIGSLPNPSGPSFIGSLHLYGCESYGMQKLRNKLRQASFSIEV